MLILLLFNLVGCGLQRRFLTRAFPTPDRGRRLILMAARFQHKGVTFVYWRC